MLRTCVLDFEKSWDNYLPLADFPYNNSYQSTIGMPPFEALYGKKCRSPICWEEVGDRRIFGPGLIQEATEKIKLIKERMKAARAGRKLMQTIAADH